MPPPKLGGSRGIGPAVVRRIAAVGWDVSFSCHHDGQTAREAEKAVSELGARVVAAEVHRHGPRGARRHLPLTPGPEGATAHPGWLTGGPIGVTR